MPQVRAEFNYQPSADAERYEIYLGTQRLGFSDTLQFTADLELEYGVHRFSVRGINVDGNGPFISTQAELLESYVPLPTPGPIGALEVSLTILGSGVGGGEPPAVSGTNESRINDIVLRDSRIVPFSYTTPSDPVTTTTFNVPADGSFATAVATSGRRVVVAAGYTGAGASNWGNDVDVVMSNTATITSACSFGSSQRIRWTGGSVIVSADRTMSVDNGSDILIDNVYLETSSGSSVTELNINSNPFSRVAFLNTTFTHNSGQYPIFTRGATGSIRNSGLIVANCKSLVTEKASRIQAVENLIVVDSVFLGHITHNGVNPTGLTSEISTGVGFRLHEQNGNLGGVFLDSMVTTAVNHWGTQSSYAVPGVLNATIDNYHVYHNAHRLFMIDNGETNTGTVSNSTTHTGIVSSPESITGLSGMSDGGGNQTVSWDVTVGSIDYDIGITGKTTLADYGADH